MKAPAPLGFMHLRDAADVVGGKLYGSSWGSITERLPSVVQLRVQRKLEPDGDAWRVGDGWWWDVISVKHVIAEGIANTEAAAWQEAHNAASKANLVVDPPIEIDSMAEHVIRTVAEACERGDLACACRSFIGGTENLDCSVWTQHHWRNFFYADSDPPIFVRQRELTHIVRTLRPVAKKRPSKSRVSDTELRKIVRDYDASRPAGTNPSMPRALAFARDKANLVGNRDRLRAIYRDHFKIRGRGRPSKGKKK
jgi:hypothetical protein